MALDAVLVRVTSILLVAAISGCTPTPPPPVLSLEGRPCTIEPDRKTAQKLVLATDKPITITLDEHAACFGAVPEASSVYVAFDLPQSSESYLLSVGSTQLGAEFFSPRLQLLDTDGKILREVGRDGFTFHGQSVSVRLRTHPGERYLIVSSDPTSVGESTSRIQDGVKVNTYAAGPIFFTVHTGHEGTSTSINAHNGIITVSAQPMPKIQ